MFLRHLLPSVLTSQITKLSDEPQKLVMTPYELFALYEEIHPRLKEIMHGLTRLARDGGR
jgi:hypothetical protein